MSQHLHHHLKLHHLHFTEINELYIALSLQAFSVGLVGIFVPIYLYTLGFSLFEIAMFFITTAIFTMIPFPIVSQHVLRKGPKHVIMISFVIMFFYIVLLYSLPSHRQLLYASAVVGGVAEGFFWTARHIDLAILLNKQKAASQFSILLIFSTLAQAAAPLVGGIIASTFGIQYAFLGTSLGLLIAIYPLLSTPEPTIVTKETFSLLRTAPPRHLLANFASNAQGTIGVFLWPFFIYTVVKTYKNVGIIASLSLLLVVALLFILGRIGDKGRNSHMLTVGSAVRSLGHIARAASRTFAAALGASVLGDVGDTVVSVPYAVHFYTEAKTYNLPAYLTDMEIAACFGKIIPWLVLVDISSYTSLEIAFVATLVLAATLMPLVRLIEPIATVD